MNRCYDTYRSAAAELRRETRGLIGGIPQTGGFAEQWIVGATDRLTGGGIRVLVVVGRAVRRCRQLHALTAETHAAELGANVGVLAVLFRARAVLERVTGRPYTTTTLSKHALPINATTTTRGPGQTYSCRCAWRCTPSRCARSQS
jgi:hypothetical protein